MSKFSKGDKARVISVDSMDVKAGVKVGDIVTIDEDNTSIPCVILSNNQHHTMMKRQLEPITEPAKEITLNGATYLLKEEQKVEHEWKFGDVAVHEEYGVVLVGGTYSHGRVKIFTDEEFTTTNPHDLTFLRRADLSI